MTRSTLQLQSATPPAAPTDLAAGLAQCARERGQRPAVTVLSPAGRAEQGYITLAQWAAKGAHLLAMDLAAGPGTRVAVDVPPGWTLAAACAAVWWIGGTVVLGAADDVAGAIVHEARPRPDVADVFVVGDAVDGGTTAATSDLVWAEEVQAFPDAPPPPGASPDLSAIAAGGEVLTHADVVAALASQRGSLGVDLATFDGDGVVEVAARPLVTGRTTLVLRDLERDAAAGDKVAGWA